MTEIIQRLRTEFVFDTMSAGASLARLRGEYEKLEAAAKRYSAIPPRLEADIALARTPGADYGRTRSRINAGAMPTEAEQIAQIEADLRRPPELGPVDFGRGNSRASAGIHFMNQVADSAIIELTMMETAFEGLTKADREAERQAKKSKGTWGDFSSGLKKGAKDAFQPITDIGSAVLEVGKGFGVFGGAAYAAITAISAISDAFSRSQETVDAYGAALDGLPAKLQAYQDANRGFWADRLGLDKLPGQSEAEKRRAELEALTGTQNTTMAPGKEGAFEQLERDKQGVYGFIQMQQREARRAGFEVDEAGNIRDPRVGYVHGSTQTQREGARRELIGQTFTTTDGKETRDYQGALELYAQIEASQQAMGDRVQSLLRDMSDPMQNGMGKVLADIKKGEEAAAGLAPKINEIFSPNNILALVKGNQKKEKESKDLAHFMRHGKVPIDARGARITVNTRIDTDDPARFADVAIKSAFLGAAARPLSATFGLGAPMVGGARKP